MMRIALAVLALTVIAAPASAGTVTITDWTTGHFANNAANGGGGFKATTANPGPLGVSEFLTFCIEFNEHIGYGGTYNYVLSNSAKLGGVSGGVAGEDPLSDETRWLYYNARTGGYAALVTAVSGNLNDSGAYFQEAIWFLEGERTAAQITAFALALAQNATVAVAGGAWTTAFAAGHRVYAMNLTTLANGLAQDQLAYVRVPEPGVLAMLTSLLPVSGLGYAAMNLARRKRREGAVRG